MDGKDADQINTSGESRKSPSRLVSVLIVTCLLAIVALFIWILTPARMSLEKYNRITKGTWHVRDFLIVGTVEETGRAAWSSPLLEDRRRMHLIIVRDENETATSWYDPQEFPESPPKGHTVTIKGYFSTGLDVRIGHRGYTTIGIAESIKITEVDK